MQDENTNPTPETNQIPDNPGSKRSRLTNLSKKRMAILGACAVLIIVGGLYFFLSRDTEPTTTHNNSSVTEPAAELVPVTYAECTEVADSIIDSEAGTCTTPDGEVFFMTNNPEDGGTSEVPTVVVAGEQSADLHIGSTNKQDPDYLWSVTYGSGYKEHWGLVATDTPLMFTQISQGQAKKNLDVRVLTENLDPASCTLTIDTDADKPGDTSDRITMSPKALQNFDFIDGTHVISLDCPTKVGKVLKVKKHLIVTDKQPELCKGFNYSEPAGSPASAEALQSSMIGTWSGCVTSPSSPDYHAVISFNQNGTYNASADEDLDGFKYNGGFYLYNTAGQSPLKVFGINSIQDGAGQGYVDVIRVESKVVQRAGISNIKQSGNLLSFDFKLTPKSAPIHFMLTKQ